MDVTIEQAIEIALNHFHKNEFDHASEVCREILQTAQYPPAYHLLGLIELGLNNFEKARKYVLHSMSLDSSKSVIHNTYGLILEKLGLLKRSALFYQWATFLDQHDPMLKYNLSQVLFSLNYHDEAEKNLRQAIEIEPNIDNLELQSSNADPTDISRAAFELHYRLAKVNYLAKHDHHKEATEQYQRILGAKETVFFFCPDSVVTPHFAAQCIVGRTIQSMGYQVVFLICPHLMYPFLCSDISQLPSWLQPEVAEEYENDTTLRTINQLKDYGLAWINLETFSTSSIEESIQHITKELPSNLNEIQISSIPLGELTLYELVIATKRLDFKDITSDVRFAWLKYIQNALKGYFLIDRVCQLFPVQRLIYFHDYSLMLSANLAAKKSGVGSTGIDFAQNQASDRQQYVFFSEQLTQEEQFFSVLGSWPKWRKLCLTNFQIKQVADDLMFRFAAKSLFIYSPSRKLEQPDFYKQLNLRKNKKTIVAYTSSLDELRSSQIRQKALDLPIRRNLTQPFENQIEWLTAIVKYVEQSDELQLVVRVHPREGKNQRDSVISQHLRLLKEAFDKPFRNSRFVWPESDISSYDLAEIADLALTSWSTLGIELARCAIPVLTSTHGLVPFPKDDFLEWGSTSEEYFRKVNFLLNNPSSLETVIHAFRWVYLFNLGNSVDLSDIVPTSVFDGIPEYKVPMESEIIKQATLDGKDVLSVNLNRQIKMQKSQSSMEEKTFIKQQLARIFRFIFTGTDTNDSITLQWQNTINGSDFTIKSCRPILISEIHGDTVTCQIEDQHYQRFSPMCSRIAKLIDKK